MQAGPLIRAPVCMISLKSILMSEPVGGGGGGGGGGAPFHNHVSDTKKTTSKNVLRASLNKDINETFSVMGELC